ncbi:hypothetical protein CGJ15_24480, partial [Vibrio parahaemolyticus]
SSAGPDRFQIARDGINSAMKSFVCLVAVFTVCAALSPGHIENFIQTDSGDGTITLEWDFVEGADPLEKYTLMVNNDPDYTISVRCPLSHCSVTVDYLYACTAYKFDLIPFFTDPSIGSYQGDVATYTGFADDDPVTSPSNLVVAGEDDTGTTLQWDAPAENAGCVDHYEVCTKPQGSEESVCESVEDTSATISSLQACGTYDVTVTPVTLSGNEGPSVADTITTEDGVPGPPTDVVVGIITDSTIDLKWNDPLTNPLCLWEFSITCGPITKLVKPGYLRAEEEYDNYATIGPLDACTDYQCDITAIGKSGTPSTPVTVFASTNETDPLAPPYVHVDSGNSTDSIDVTWGTNSDDKCAGGGFVICWNDGLHLEECADVPAGTDNFTIPDLSPCSRYDISVNVVTPDGTSSETVTESTTTADIVPGPVTNLMVTDVAETGVRLSFDPPTEEPQCVKEYDIRVINEDLRRLVKPMLAEGPVTDFITGLEACTNYLFKVRAITATEKEGPWTEVRQKTADSTPSDPQQFSAKEITTSSITVEWYEPATYSNCVTEYLLSWEGASGDSDSQEITSTSTFKSEVTIDGLNACESYTFSLSAKSTIGESHVVTFTASTLCA